MKRIVLITALALAAVSVVAAAALADDDGGGAHKAFLTSYEEVVGGPGPSTGSVSTTGVGRLTLRIRDDGIHFRLRYERMEGGTVVAAHIHFAQRHVGGGIIADLCGGNEDPCDGDISGVIMPGEIKGPAEQGIPVGAPGYPEAVKAIRVGATYANVHTTPSFPEGEIRGQIGGRGDD